MVDVKVLVQRIRVSAHFPSHAEGVVRPKVYTNSYLSFTTGVEKSKLWPVLLTLVLI